MDDHLSHSRRLNARMRAKAIGLDPDELDWEDAEQRPTFSPNGTQKSIEITALIRLLEKRYHAQQAATNKAKKPARSAA